MIHSLKPSFAHKGPALRQKNDGAQINWPSYAGSSRPVGTSPSGRVSVYVDPNLGAQGLQNANDFLKDADRVVSANDAIFGTTGGPVNVIVFAIDGATDGTGGADHGGCDYQSGANIEVCASFDNSARVSALFEAELSECSMGGNLCGASTGEALSRWCASVTSGNALSDFATAPHWASDGMPDYVNKTDPTDQKADSMGCGMAFISWLLSLGHGLDKIARAMVSLGDSGTLAQLYSLITSDKSSNALPLFLKAVRALPNGVVDDDPFGTKGASLRTATTVVKHTFPIEHVVIIFKENHGFDNYFGTFPEANGDKNLPHLPDPPLNDPRHTHEAWLKRATNAVKGQYHGSDIPNYFSLAKQFTLCDNYFTDVAGPSTPNHLMAIAADSPIIDNPHPKDPKKFQPPFDIPSLPENLQRAGLEWKNYGGYAFNYIQNLKHDSRNVIADKFAQDAEVGALPHVSWVYGPKNRSEHPTERVADGDAWTATQVSAIVKGGLWPTTAIFITWDDWGGWYDHVTPPELEKWSDGTQFRYGNRVGCIVAGPYAKSSHISSVLHSHVSIVKFCETIFGLPAINKRDRAADDMLDCFDFKQNPLVPPN